jgi:hypothetical protein
METNRSSLLKGLAVAFGDGLAFGVGVKLSSSRPWERRTSLGSGVLADDAGAFDARVLKKVVAALDARIEQHGAQVDRKLAEVEAAFALELKGLDERRRRDIQVLENAVLELRAAVRAAAAGPGEEWQKRLGQVEAAVVSMRTEVEAGSRRVDELGGRLPDLAAKSVEARLRELVPQLQAAVVSMRAEVEAGSRRVDELGERLPDLAAREVEARLRELLPELERRLSEQSSQTGRDVQSLLSSVAQFCEQAAQNIARPAGGPPASGHSGGAGEPPAEQGPDAAPAAGTPDMFSAAASGGSRRPLLVSSFVVAVAALACLRLLV